jgi:hypothetical protein
LYPFFEREFHHFFNKISPAVKISGKEHFHDTICLPFRKNDIPGLLQLVLNTCYMVNE